MARQESLKRYISSEQLAYGNIDKTDGIPDAYRDKIEPTSSLINGEVDPPNDESVEKLLRSYEEHRNFSREGLKLLSS